MGYNIEHIKGNSLPDAWFQAIYRCVDKGRDFTIDQGSFSGSKRLEMDFVVVEIDHPELRPVTPQIPEHYNISYPCSEEYLNEYALYLVTGDGKKGEAYTYGQRLNAQPVGIKIDFDNPEIWIQDILTNEKLMRPVENAIDESHFDVVGYILDQVSTLIEVYKTKGDRNNQMILQIAEPADILLKDPPCLRHIDTRIQDDKLHFFPYFRSWDLWAGFPANLAAIQFLKEYIAGELGVEPGKTIATSKGLHLYDYVWKYAELLRGKEINCKKKLT